VIGPSALLSGGILIVDDQPANVRLLERMLLGAGYTSVSSTLEPREVCELHRKNRYDLILLDLHMPGLDGFQVMAGLKAVETEGYLPVLVLTAQPEHRQRALSAGAKDFVSKPFDQVEVLTRIHNLLEVRLLLRESRRHGELLERYDPLTGLPNRTLYRELLTRSLLRPGAGKAAVSVLFVALDRFKNVNEALGRVIGDGVLCRVADRLRGCIGPMDTVARLGGDEFGLIVASASGDAPGSRAMANKVREALRAPLDVAGPEVAVTASIGIALSPMDSTDADALMKYADTALHQAKDAGRDSYRFYSAEMNARAQAALDVENALRNALQRGDFILHYQPKMRIDTGEWSGVEALIRWDRPGYGLVAPLEFIPVLEETGLIVPVGSWVIERACGQIAEWDRSGVGKIRVAVNVSPRQFLRDGFVPHVARALRDNDIAPELLEIEITESCLMARSQEVDDVLRELKALGISISIDDFGTGYSSLAYLKRFPIDTLKIDVSFIRDVTTSPSAAAIAVAIVQMARCLKMKVIAEGVDTAAQLEFLREQACDEIQGYYCARPMPAAELAQRLSGGASALRGEGPVRRPGGGRPQRPSVS
jgi:diguanylate cyclase (GGDEF)-like protein